MSISKKGLRWLVAIIGLLLTCSAILMISNLELKIGGDAISGKTEDFIYLMNLWNIGK